MNEPRIDSFRKRRRSGGPPLRDSFRAPGKEAFDPGRAGSRAGRPFNITNSNLLPDSVCLRQRRIYLLSVVNIWRNGSSGGTAADRSSFGARRVAALFPNGNRTARLSEIFDPPLGSRHTHSIIYGWCRCEGWAAAVGGSHVDCTSAATDRCNNVEVECVHRTDAKIFAQCAANEKSKHGRKGRRGRMGCSRDVQKKSIE
jgi:hypothetical protein